MADTITSSAGPVITPSLVLGYQSSRQAGTLVHEIPGSANPDVTLRPAMLRSGDLEIVFFASNAESLSKSAENALSAAASFTLGSNDRSTIEMTFVVQGAVSRRLDPESLKYWTLSFSYQEFS